MQRITLPIDKVLPEILRSIAAHNCLIVDAPPGSGKTTRVAPALLRAERDPEETALHGSQGGDSYPAKELILVQPRRIAARASAARIAFELGCQVGQRVGYQVRFDARIGKATELICVTPGILLRRLHGDPLLEQVTTVVLDEFHERSLEVDLLLGMLRRIQTAIRPELRIVIMSATLEADALSQVLDSPPIIEVEAAAYPVSIRHCRFQSTRRSGPRGHPLSPSRRIVEQATETTLEAARSGAGDILVFLPGVGEIMQVARRLEPEAAKHGWELLTLYGDLSPREQDRVLAECARRKIILSTNVAETSLTIDGVTTVVDSGWARVKRIDPSLGLDMLVLEPISQASAKQRAGRAGRTAPGICYRLWDQVTDRSRPQYLEPEVLRVDLAGAVLQLTSWGELELSDFPWVTQPRAEALAQAAQLLQRIDATTCKGRVTALGQVILKLPVHPRIGRFLVAAHELGIPAAGAMAAALLSERDVFERRGAAAPTVPHACDLTQRVLALQQFNQTGNLDSPSGTIKATAARSLQRIADQFLQLVAQELGSKTDVPLDTQIQQALLTTFPDRLARRRAPGSGRGLMVGGRGVKLDAASGVQQTDLFLCLDVDAGSSEALVRQASAIESDWLPVEHLREVDERFYNPTQAAVVTRRRLYWLDLLIAETPIATPTDDETARILAGEAAKQFHRLLPSKDRELEAWLARLQWLSQAMPDSGLPSLETDRLAEHIWGWCFGMKSLSELKTLPWKSLLQGLLNADQRQLLRTGAPESVALPSGRQVLLKYEVGKSPILAARIQEFFGLTETPRLAGGRIPLLLHLLAPNNRVQQITDDLASFWVNTYPTVRKELRGRYPKHAWPENPLQ